MSRGLKLGDAGGPLVPFALRLTSAFAADPVVVAVQAEGVWRQHPDRTLDIVGAVPGPTRAVVVPDAVMQACVRVGGIAVPGRRLGGGRLGGGRVGHWCRGGGWAGGGRPDGGRRRSHDLLRFFWCAACRRSFVRWAVPDGGESGGHELIVSMPHNTTITDQ